MKKFLNISELANLLLLVDKNKKPLTYILRYWEKEFTQIRPLIIKKRRHYSIKQVEIIKLIKFLLKDKGMTVNGVKNILKSNINTLDDYNSFSLKADYYKENIKKKSTRILNLLKNLKKHGKKNTH